MLEASIINTSKSSEPKGTSQPAAGLEPLEDRSLPSVLLSSSHWTAVGPASIQEGPSGSPLVSGRLTGIAANPTNANVIYVAAAGGGVWKTINGGTSWTPLTDGQSTLFMGAIALAPSSPNTIYAGTGEANNSGDSFYGRGVLKSTDGGTTWKLLGTTLFNHVAISKIVVDPTNANTVYVAIDGNASNGSFSSGNVGVWKSTDGGTTWKNTTTGIANVDHNVDDFSDLVIDPVSPQTLYTAVGTYYGARGNGIYKTTNGGTSWAFAGDAPKGAGLGRITLAISKTSDQTLYASISNPNFSGGHFGELLEMLKTTNGGAHWTPLSNTPNYMGSNGFGQGWYDTTLAVDPTNANVVFAGGSGNGGSPGIIESTNGGATWSDIYDVLTGPHSDDHALVFDDNDKLLDGNDGGIWRLANPAPRAPSGPTSTATCRSLSSRELPCTRPTRTLPTAAARITGPRSSLARSRGRFRRAATAVSSALIPATPTLSITNSPASACSALTTGVRPGTTN